ncbi:DUF1349 domain-containing protein (plasmid) [Sinorhizobium meliloti]|nr:DUF1349 domain-containing protein [Sinorhizobium meliloti]
MEGQNGKRLSLLNERQAGRRRTLCVAQDRRQDGFWAETFYGSCATADIAYLRPVSGDIHRLATIVGQYEQLYDQRSDAAAHEQNWIKCGIEYTDGLMAFQRGRDTRRIGLVGHAVARKGAFDPLEVRLTRHDDAVRVQFRFGEERWQRTALSLFRRRGRGRRHGLFARERAGFAARFRDLNFGPPIARALHDD